MGQLSLMVGMDRAAPPAGWRPDPMPNLAGVARVGYDLETTGLQWWNGDRPVGVAVAWRDGDRLERRYLPFGHADSPGQYEPEQVHAWCRDQLAGKTLVGLNVPFDAHHSREWRLDLEELGCRLADVGHRAALLDDHRREFNLESIAQEELGEGKVQGLEGANIWRYPAWQVEEYARQDAGLVVRIEERQRPRLEAEELLDVVALEDECIYPTMEMERNAARMDLEKLRRWVRESQEAHVTLLWRLAKEAGFRVNPDSPDDMARLFHERGIEITEWTKGSVDGRVPPRPSFTDAVLEAAALQDPVVALARECAHLADLRSKYLVPYDRDVRDDALLRFQLNQLRGDEGGTVSGRYSSSRIRIDGRYIGANIQQVLALEKQLRVHCRECAAGWRDKLKDAEKIARHYAHHAQAWIVRELFVAAVGRKLLRADAKQIEYRVFAHLANSPRLTKAYEDDPHLDYHELTGAIVRKRRPEFERKRTKNCNFAVLFGAGLDKTAGMMSVDVEEAKQILRDYDDALPEARNLMRKAVEVAKQRHYVKTILGRRARVRPCPKHEWQEQRGCRSCPRYHSMLNRAVQGSAADLNKKKMVALHRERKRLQLTMRMTIHDEFVGDVPDDPEAVAAVDEVLQRQEIKLRVPILWDVNVGNNWAECK